MTPDGAGPPMMRERHAHALQVLATFISVVSTLSPDTNEFRRMMDELNGFMHREALPVPLQRRLREYFHQTKHLRVSKRQHELIKFMSPALQSEVIGVIA